MNRTRSILASLARRMPAIVAGAVLLAVWSAAVRLLQIEPYVLPGPEETLRALWLGWGHGRLYAPALFTIQATMAGLFIGCFLGVALGILAGEIEPIGKMFYPLVVGIQAMPLIAIAPLLVVWLGIGIESKIFMVAQLCFFPTFVSTIAGMRAAGPELLDLYRTFDAGRWHTLRNVRLPAAASFIFGGLQISVVLSLIGCVVAEFVASTSGLGALVKSLSGDLDVAMMFAAILSLGIMGAIGGLTVRWLHRRLAFWEFEQPQRSAKSRRQKVSR